MDVKWMISIGLNLIQSRSPWSLLTSQIEFLHTADCMIDDVFDQI